MRPPQRKESSIESAVVKWCRRNHVLTAKIQGVGNKGWPDRMFIRQDGSIAFIEFKRPGQKPTALQEYTHGELRKYGREVYIVASVEHAIEILESAQLPTQDGQVRS